MVSTQYNDQAWKKRRQRSCTSFSEPGRVAQRIASSFSKSLGSGKPWETSNPRYEQHSETLLKSSTGPPTRSCSAILCEVVLLQQHGPRLSGSCLSASKCLASSKCKTTNPQGIESLQFSAFPSPTNFTKSDPPNPGLDGHRILQCFWLFHRHLGDVVHCTAHFANTAFVQAWPWVECCRLEKRVMLHVSEDLATAEHDSNQRGRSGQLKMPRVELCSSLFNMLNDLQCRSPSPRSLHQEANGLTKALRSLFDFSSSLIVGHVGHPFWTNLIR